MLLHGRERFAMAGGDVDELELWTGRLDQLRKPPEHATVVVNEQYPDRLSGENRHNPP
jgi:hypothetical protein